MPWKNEILRAFFVAFGAAQTLSNLFYLLRADGAALARKQHRELPKDNTDKQIFIKVIGMFLFGVLFLFVGLLSCFMHTYFYTGYLLVLGLFVSYILTEALYYKYWRTTCAFLFSAAVLIIAII